MFRTPGFPNPFAKSKFLPSRGKRKIRPPPNCSANNAELVVVESSGFNGDIKTMHVLAFAFDGRASSVSKI